VRLITENPAKIATTLEVMGKPKLKRGKTVKKLSNILPLRVVAN